MSTIEVGQKLVAFSNQDRSDLALAELYAADIVSIEADGFKSDGIDAVKEKHDAWDGQNDVHAVIAEGPYIGAREDQFVVKFDVDTTPTDAERTRFLELGIYTVKDNRVVREEFLPLAS